MQKKDEVSTAVVSETETAPTTSESETVEPDSVMPNPDAESHVIDPLNITLRTSELSSEIIGDSKTLHSGSGMSTMTHTVSVPSSITTDSDATTSAIPNSGLYSTTGGIKRTSRARTSKAKVGKTEAPNKNTP